MPFPVGDNITCDSPEGFSPDGGSRAEYYENIKLCEMNWNKITCESSSNEKTELCFHWLNFSNLQKLCR